MKSPTARTIPAKRLSFPLLVAATLSLSFLQSARTSDVMPKSNSASHKTQQTQSMDTSTLNRQIASVLPRPDEERWLTIPWRQNLMQTRLEAQQYNRPIFMWVMNGNPLGCT